MLELNFCKEKEILTNMNQSTFVVDKKWYSVYTQSKTKKKDYKRLVKQNTNFFLPLEIFQNQWSNSIKKITNHFIFPFVFLKTANNSINKFGCNRKNCSWLLNDML